MPDNRQPASTHAIPVHHENASGEIVRRQRLQNLAHARDHVGIAPVAVAEQDQAWVARLRQREQARIVEISGDDGPPLLLRASQDFDVGLAIEAQFGGMSTRNFTVQLVSASSIISSSARKAA